MQTESYLETDNFTETEPAKRKRGRKSIITLRAAYHRLVLQAAMTGINDEERAELEAAAEDLERDWVADIKVVQRVHMLEGEIAQGPERQARHEQLANNPRMAEIRQQIAELNREYQRLDVEREQARQLAERSRQAGECIVLVKHASAHLFGEWPK